MRKTITPWLGTEFFRLGLFICVWLVETSYVISMPGHGGQYSNGQTYPQCNWCSYWYAIATRRGLTICFPIWALREGITHTSTISSNGDISFILNTRLATPDDKNTTDIPPEISTRDWFINVRIGHMGLWFPFRLFRPNSLTSRGKTFVCASGELRLVIFKPPFISFLFDLPYKHLKSQTFSTKKTYKEIQNNY